jgi:predicted MFS family arabinose efflux permease
MEAMVSVVQIYAMLCCLIFFCYCCMNRKEMEPRDGRDKDTSTCTGIKPENKNAINTLSALFAVDAFAGAFIVQSYLSCYYESKYDLHFDAIGGILFACSIVSGISGVLSSKLTDKIGAVPTMIYTHLPSNILLISVGFTSNLAISIILLFAHFCISQMDVPARQTYVAMVVSSEEQPAANRITNVARSVGLALGLGLNGIFMAHPADSAEFSYPFIVAGGLKIVYDVAIGCLLLWNSKQKREEGVIKVESTDLVETPITEEDNKLRWIDA